MSTPTPPESQNRHSALFIRTYIAFKDIIDSIFGKELAEDWKDILDLFKKCILELEAQVDLNYKFKFHFLFEHIPYYVEKFGALGKYNEQTIEAAHHSWNEFFTKYNINTNNPDFAMILIAMCAWNARAL